jgi:hypothetical protein
MCTLSLTVSSAKHGLSTHIDLGAAIGKPVTQDEAPSAPSVDLVLV